MKSEIQFTPLQSKVLSALDDLARAVVQAALSHDYDVELTKESDQRFADEVNQYGAILQGWFHALLKSGSDRQTPIYEDIARTQANWIREHEYLSENGKDAAELVADLRERGLEKISRETLRTGRHRSGDDGPWIREKNGVYRLHEKDGNQRCNEIVVTVMDSRVVPGAEDRAERIAETLKGFLNRTIGHATMKRRQESKS